MKQIKKLIGIILVFSIVVSIAGCSKTTKTEKLSTTSETKETTQTEEKQSKEVASEPVTVTFWNGFTGPDGEILKDIVSRFNDANKGKIEIQMDIMGWDVLSQKLPPSIATDTAPSMALLIGDWIPQYIANDSFQSMNDFWDVSGLKEDAYLQNVLDLGKYNDAYYSLPMQFNLIYLFWNKALFEAAGLDPNKAPSSLDELADFAVKITDESKSQFGLGLPVKGAPQYWTSFFWNNGGELFDLKEKKSLLNSEANIQTLSWIKDLAQNKKVSPKGATGAELENLFMSGKLGMYINGPWFINGIKTNGIDFGVSGIPKGSVSEQTIAGNIGFCIPSGTKEAEKLAAYEFIKFWMSDEILKEWSMKNGFPAWSKAVLADSDIINDPILGAISPLSSLGRGYNPEAFEGIGALDADALWPMIELVITGDSQAKESIKITSDSIDNIFKDYQ